MKIIDLTGTLENNMWSYGDPLPRVSIENVSSLGDGKYNENNYKITLGSISGTYLETGAHRLAGKKDLIDVPVEKFFMEAVVLKLKDKNSREHISLEEVKAAKPLLKGARVLIISTGWERMWNKPDFVKDSPHFTREAFDWILDQNLEILGGDFPCFDDPRNSEGLVNKLFSKDLLILAPLVNLRKIPEQKIKIIALPLKVKHTCGCPCRAVAILEDKGEEPRCYQKTK